MGQSLTKNYIHIVFSTKHRQKILSSPIQEELWNYLGGICRKLECNPVQVGSHTDHVHVLCILSKKISFVELLSKLKAPHQNG